MPRKLFIVSMFVWGMIGIPFVGAAEPSWHTSLSYDGGGVWMSRLPIDITNNGKDELAGFPVAVPLLFSPRNPRVVRSDGQEVIFGLSQAELLIPVDAKLGETVRYYAYFDNPQAKPIPEQEMLQDKLAPIHGGFEQLDGWRFDDQGTGHQILHCSDEAHSGNFSVKVIVPEEADPSWISARQERIRIQPGAKYRFSGYVKAENVSGTSGWYIHVGPEGKPFTISPMLTTNEKTFDWRKLETEFTAPADAAIASLGTVLRGTGTAWFDDVALERLDSEDSLFKSTVGPVETCPLEVLSDKVTRYLDGYECLSRFRIVNDSDAEIKDASVLFDLRGSFAHGLVGLPSEIIVENSDGTQVSGTLTDPENRQVSAKLSVIPPRSVNYLTVYYKIDESAVVQAQLNTTSPNIEGTAHPELQWKADPYAGFPSLLKDGDFESGAGEWFGEGTIETDPDIVRFGKSCAKVTLDEKDAGSWRGYRQTIPVDGGRSYLVSAWIKCRDLPGGGRIHIHYHRADGRFCTSGSMSSIDREIRGTVDWTHFSQVITAPNDAATMTLHLTTNQPGTLWYDNLVVLDSLHAELVEVQSLPNNPDVPIWQVPTVMKVFPQSVPPQSVIDAKKEGRLIAKISAAKNETESLQLAFNYLIPTSPRRKPITVSPLTDDKGNTLPAPVISLVGYVPIDYPSNYYNDTNPRWYRKIPKSAPGCDGWPGLWPDPLYPSEDISPQIITKKAVHEKSKGDTRAVWLTWSIPKDAASGVYRGKVTFPPDQYFYYSPFSLDMPIEFTVYDFTLPDESGVGATYDARFTGPRGVWGDRDIDVYRQAVKIMGENRLAPDEVKPAPRVSFRNGRFEFDWTEFDKAAKHLFEDLHIKYVYTPNLFYLFGWGHPPKDFYGEKPYEGEWPYKDADHLKLRPEYKTRYQAALREFWHHVKEKGWAERFVLYISDEPNYWEESIKQQMIALCEMIHEVDPAIPIYSSTWSYIPEWADSLNVWGIGHYGAVPPETMEAIRQHGSRIWFTTDGMMCLDTPYSAIERLLPHYCFKYGAEAYEFWGIGWLTFDPWEYGFHAYIHQSSTPGEYYWVRYPNGDGYLLYPDPEKKGKMHSSIRLEQARDGVEDYEYLRMLQTLIDDNPTHPEVDSAKQALEEAKTLVESPTQIGRYSTRILPNPYRLEQTRESVARAIEKFSR